MSDTLLIFKLKIKSSYVRNQELPADEVFDTLQIYVHGDTVMRIRTYAIDHDIHIHQIPLRERSVAETVEFLTTSTKEHYGDIIDQEYTLQLDSPKDTVSAEKFFTDEYFHKKLVSETNYAYWNPSDTTYENKSNPFATG